MMSTAVSTSRASSRQNKDKNAKAASRPQVKTEETSSKMHQATPEQLRLAQISQISEDETIFRQKVQQIIDLTGKTEMECEIALHDCQQDTEKAINMLLEGEHYQGEWRETGGKKKKRANPPNKTEPQQNSIDEKQDKNEQNFEPRERPDRSGDNRPESNSRRGRRFDSRPPRLARGRGRERGDGGFRGNRDSNDHDNKENGFGTFDKDRDTDGRGRGRGRGGPRRGGRGRNPRFDKGPQIDTWTNETAANAEKENAASPWESMEDWNEDTWTGSLSETKVFTATTTQEDPVSENTTPMADTTNTLGQRLDLGALLQKPTSDPSEPAYITQYNQQATESIKNSIGIGSSPRQNLSNQLGGSALTNHMQTGPLSSQLPSSSLSNQLSVSQQSSSDAINALVSSFGQNQTSYSQSSSGFSQSVSAYSQSPPGYSQTSSGFSQGQSTYSQSPSSVYSQNQTSAYSQSQSSGFSQNTGSVYSSNLEQNSGGQVDSVPSSQSGLQQRPKSQRTKLPPPSKIPASAVEMPGHMTTRLDVQFGTWEYGSDNSSPFSFGGESSVTSSMSSAGPSSTTQTITGHLPPQQVSSKPSESVISSSIMTTPPANSTSAMSGGDQTSPRTNIFHASPYTTPTKKDSASRSQNKMSPPEPIPFPPSQSDRKSSPMINSQHPGSSSSLSSGPLATSKPDSTNLNSFSQSTQGYASTTYPSQKTGLSTNSGRSSATGLSSSTGLSNAAGLSNSTGITNNSGLSNSAGLSSTSGFSHSSSSQPGSYQNQYQTGSNQYQTSQNQFPSGQNQYQSGQNQYQSSTQNQFHSNQNQFQNYGQSTGSSFQNSNSYSSGSGSYSGSSSQQTQGNLYPSSGTNSYQSTNSLYHQGNSSQTTSYQPQTNSSSYHGARDSQAGSYPTSVSRDSQSASFQANVSQSGSYPTSGSRDSQTGSSFQASVTQSSATSYQRDSQSALSTPATQTQSVYTTSQGYGTSPHQNSLPSNLQTSPLSGVSANKISETLSKMTVKDSSLDTRQSPQYDSSTSTTTSNLTTTTITTSLATRTTTPSAVVSTIALTTTVGSTKVMTAPSTSTTKNTPNLPPGVLLGHQYIMGQGTMPPYFGLQQPLYASYTDELQLQLQQRLPPTLANYNYDMSGFGVPTTMTGRDQNSLGNVPYSAADNKIGRVDAQSPIPASQQQSTQSAHQQQHFINLPYGYYYPSVLPSAAGFQYPTMFPVPPVTNTAHAGTTANTQYQKTYGASHAYASNKGGYEDLTQGSDFGKSSYGNPAQNKVSGVTGSVASVPGAADMPGSGYGKSHTQAFDKQGFHAGTPPPFNLPLATGTQAGPLGAPTTPYGAAPFMNVPMMPPHNQMLHPNMQQQDSTTGSSRGSHVHSQQNSTQAKAGGAKAYANSNWNY